MCLTLAPFKIAQFVADYNTESLSSLGLMNHFTIWGEALIIMQYVVNALIDLD